MIYFFKKILYYIQHIKGNYINNIMFYSSFKRPFTNFYEIDNYDRILFTVSECSKKVYGNNLFRFKDRMMIINSSFRNEKNYFSKMIDTIDILMSSDSVITILEKNGIDTGRFINIFNKHLLMVKFNKPSSEEKEIKDTLKKFYDVGMYFKNLWTKNIKKIRKRFKLKGTAKITIPFCFSKLIFHFHSQQ